MQIPEEGWTNSLYKKYVGYTLLSDATNFYHSQAYGTERRVKILKNYIMRHPVKPLSMCCCGGA